MDILDNYCNQAVSFLEKMVRIPSVSYHEEQRADFIVKYLQREGINIKRTGNNIIATLDIVNHGMPTLMLNSHIDTVTAVKSYTFDPVNPPLSADKVLGLGSNDAGGCVSSMIHTFLYFAENKDIYKTLNVNIALVLSAEEERSGDTGMTGIADSLTRFVDYAIIGEPTSMNAAIAERGLLVIDAVSKGKSGHAARNEGVNALYIAIDDIEKLRNYRFAKKSPLMGEVKMTVTQIEAGTAHNVIPDTCRYVVDIRPTDCYTNQEIFNILMNELKSDLSPRSLTNKTSSTPEGHHLIKTINKLNITSYISPTTSDWMRLALPAIKMGPGESSRSHKEDEYILKSEIFKGVEGYINFIKEL
ncbi:MAG: M20/M25/M40 family metallo-hydrolase [Bacteroidales bacterium]|nr:M20/M25/M40 family metallo-hydrolase [Bacteroidales bacterium]